MMHCGSDSRYPPMQYIIDNHLGFESSKGSTDTVNFLRKLIFVKISELSADQIISTRDQATFQMIPYNHFCFPMKTLAEQKDIILGGIIRIVHVPSNRNLKGTTIVLNAINKLTERGHNFDFILLENKKMKMY